MSGMTIGKLAAAEGVGVETVVGGEIVKQVVGARSKSALLREFGEVLASAAV